MSHSRNLNCPLSRNVVNIVQTVCRDEAFTIRVLQRQEYLDPNRTKASCLPSDMLNWRSLCPECSESRGRVEPAKPENGPVAYSSQSSSSSKQSPKSFGSLPPCISRFKSTSLSANLAAAAMAGP